LAAAGAALPVVAPVAAAAAAGATALSLGFVVISRVGFSFSIFFLLRSVVSINSKEKVRAPGFVFGFYCRVTNAPFVGDCDGGHGGVDVSGRRR
jgi:hypothetical protein